MWWYGQWCALRNKAMQRARDNIGPGGESKVAGRGEREARVFPLLASSGSRSPCLETCIEAVRSQGFHVTVGDVQYEFQRGGNEVLRIRPS